MTNGSLDILAFREEKAKRRRKKRRKTYIHLEEEQTSGEGEKENSGLSSITTTVAEEMEQMCRYQLASNWSTLLNMWQ